MDVFISYHSEDVGLVQELETHLPASINLTYWDQSNVPGDPDWESIDAWLEEAELVVVIVTPKTLARAISVGQEIGRARSLEKRIIPVVSDKVSPSQLGAIKGTTALRFDESNAGPALARLAQLLDQHRREARNEVLALGGLAAAGLYLLGRKAQNSANRRPPNL